MAKSGAIQRWANATRTGKTPEDWKAPDSASLEHILTEEPVFYRHNAILREVEIRLSAHSFSMQMEVAAIEGDLSEKRKRWLNAFIDEASEVWPLVRFTMASDERSLVAEVNLTGAPHPAIVALIGPSLDSFRWIVKGLVETAEFITSPEIESGIINSFLPSGPAVQAVNTNKITN
ncbi:unnamed protein product [marine sediment metagenome]|uniref:YbjN domain-containing protein n=1 Tax=marine sediment metagenome TaxID=412755 RepID=X1CPN5_9ZZZZ